MQRHLRPVIVVALVLLVGATALAQRGGYRGGFTAYGGNVPYDGRFVFVRMSYPWQQRQAPYWSHDYPDGEENFLKILQSITNMPLHVNESSIMAFSDPEIFKFPLLYLVEPGYLWLSDAEVVSLRAYLQKGGFLILDDFPDWAWGNTELHFSRVFPDLKWIDLDVKHPIFHSFFEINSFDIIPQYYMRGRPIFRALFEGNDPTKRMMVMANYNTDLSEYWEHSATGIKPVEEDNEAFKIGVNQFIYGITH